LLTILLDNAIHYSEQAPEIVVSLDQTRDGYMISVQDKGSGIDPAELPHVFERFRRGSRGLQQNADGSGLGLPLAKAIAESHGGSITIESAAGSGTTVVVLLPEAARRMGGP
jgi:signal transduction histidine kinase